MTWPLAMPGCVGSLFGLFPVWDNRFLDFEHFHQFIKCFEIQAEHSLVLLDPQSLSFTGRMGFGRT